MQVTFKPTNYRFTFNDQFFVQLKYSKESTRVSLRLQDETPFVACFADANEAKQYVINKMLTDDDVVYGWVFSRDQQVWAAGD
jgi:hypothetical protein